MLETLEDAVLVFDGVFLLRPELIDQWDLRILTMEPLADVAEKRSKGVRVRLTGPVPMADEEFGTVAEGIALTRDFLRDTYDPVKRGVAR